MARIELSDDQYARLLAVAGSKGLTPIGWIIATLLRSDDERRESDGAGFLSESDRADLAARVEQERVEPSS
ncbi:MAG TPA: hypothetical protein VFR37_21870 [Longimicrobium sp.]|nr:hypothetical protein [Longimicrobium sp.]